MRLRGMRINKCVHTYIYTYVHDDKFAYELLFQCLSAGENKDEICNGLKVRIAQRQIAAANEKSQ